MKKAESCVSQVAPKQDTVTISKAAIARFESGPDENHIDAMDPYEQLKYFH